MDWSVDELVEYDTLGHVVRWTGLWMSLWNMILWGMLSGGPTDRLPETVSISELHRARATARPQSTHRRRYIP